MSFLTTFLRGMLHSKRFVLAMSIWSLALVFFRMIREESGCTEEALRKRGVF